MVYWSWPLLKVLPRVLPIHTSYLTKVGFYVILHCIGDHN